jgi:hypothetical protein
MLPSRTPGFSQSARWIFRVRWELNLKQSSFDPISQSLQNVLEVSGLPHSALRRCSVHAFLSVHANYVALVSPLSTPDALYERITTPVTGRTTLQSDQLALAPDPMDGQSAQHNQLYAALLARETAFCWSRDRSIYRKKRNITRALHALRLHSSSETDLSMLSGHFRPYSDMG